MKIREVRRIILLFFMLTVWLSVSPSTVKSQNMTIDANGNVGIGTESPTAKLDVNGSLNAKSYSLNRPSALIDGGNTIGGRISFTPDNFSAGSSNGYLALMYPDDNTVKFSADFDGHITGGHYRNIQFGNVVRTDLTIDTSTGNVGIGTTNPQALLHVAGSVQVDGNIAAKYQDLAEYVRTSELLTRGMVVMIDTKEINQVIPSDEAYNTLVAGVVSEAPGIILGESGADKAIIAHTGRVKVKADTNYGEISVGDLLVTSPAKGYAMKADTDKLKPGMLLGKALEPLKEGRQGEILVLITLQ